MPILTEFKQKIQILDVFLIVILCLFTFFYGQGVAIVPFHPDESTYLFMSSDWESFISNPISLTFQASDKGIPQRYRLLDPPLGRYLIGISRSIAGFSALPADWNWSLTWEENKQAGALPSQPALQAARLAPAALFPLSLLLMYFTGWRLGGRFLGWTSMLFLASNALVLIHTRRAMSESGLLFTICLFIASLVFCRKRPWLIAIPLALMVCAKHSTLPFAVIGLLAVVLYTIKPYSWRLLVANTAIFGAVFLTIFILLNPILWTDPFQALQTAVKERQELLVLQTTTIGQAQPGTVLNTPGKSALSLIANLFVTPPAIADVGNYLTETDASAQKYLADPVNHLFRDLVQGGLLLALTFLGFISSIKHSFDRRSSQQHLWILLNSGALVQFFSLLFTLTLPFQRYVLPLVPFTCLWAGYSLLLLKDKIGQIGLNRVLSSSG